MTIFECYNQTKKMLRDAGICDEAFEARQILRFVTKYDNAAILERYTETLSEVQASLWLVTVKQRCTRYPLQYILGEWDFYGLRFLVGEGCLAPRSDTETLVDAAFDVCRQKPDAVVLDLCAGCGCVGLTVAKRYETTRVTLVEKYEDPFRYLSANRDALGTDNATAVQEDLYTFTPGEPLDLIVSNPPYVSAAGMELLNEEAKREPPEALYGGEDGLDFYRAILCRYPAFLKDGGRIVVEIGFDQGDAVAALFREAGAQEVTVKEDLTGNQRVVFGTFHRVE